MTTYSELKERLGNRAKRKLENNTYLEQRGDSLAIRLHATDVLLFSPAGTVTASSGGWKTVTTKDRINRYSPVRVYQKRGEWHWQTGQMFTDGDCIVNGEVKAQATPAAESEKRLLRKRILKYAKLYAALPLAKPDGGDCWYCHMIEEKSGKSLGEASGNTDHLLSHLEESYVVPSLAFHAMKAAGAGQLWFATVFGEAEGFLLDSAKKQLPRWVAGYLYKQFGLPA